MTARTVIREWTVATWLLAGGRDHLASVVDALGGTHADAIALQSVRRDDAESIADVLDCRLRWDLSYYPASRLFAGSGVGLAVLTPHTIEAAAAAVSNDHPSTWSRDRRIGQVVTVSRHDQTAYAIAHVVGSGPAPDSGGYARVTIVPEQVGVDAERAISVPDSATVLRTDVTTPIATVAAMQATTFEMPWVQGDFPAL